MRFDIAALADEEAITVVLRDGRTLHSRDLLPEVIDALGQVVDRRAQEEAADEVEHRKLVRVLEDEEASDEQYASASAELTKLTTNSAKRGRALVYEQLSKVLVGEDDKPLTPAALAAGIPLPIAHRMADEMTRQILGRADAEGNGNGGDHTPTGSTS